MENNVDKPARFDVISILGAKGNKRVEHIERCFFSNWMILFLLLR